MSKNKIDMKLLAKQNRVTEIFVGLINSEKFKYSPYMFEEDVISGFIHKAIVIDNKITQELNRPTIKVEVVTEND